MAVRQDKRTEGSFPLLSTELFSVIMPRCASFFLVRDQSKGELSVDAYASLIASKGSELHLRGASAISDVVVFGFTADIIKHVSHIYSAPVDDIFAEIKSLKILPRSNWLNEVMHRYVYERTVSQNHDNTATRFLEEEIFKEVYFQIVESQRRDKSRFDLDERSLDGRSPLLPQAMAFVDSRLFRDITIRDLAKHLSVSESTVLREFKATLGMSVSGYIVKRRLEEGMNLLKSPRYSIGQVSDLVGYENPSAFSAAFKSHFGITPSQATAKSKSSRPD